MVRSILNMLDDEQCIREDIDAERCHVLVPQGIYYALLEGETPDDEGIRLPDAKEYFEDLEKLNGIIHSGKDFPRRTD